MKVIVKSAKNLICNLTIEEIHDIQKKKYFNREVLRLENTLYNLCVYVNGQNVTYHLYQNYKELDLYKEVYYSEHLVMKASTKLNISSLFMLNYLELLEFLYSALEVLTDYYISYEYNSERIPNGKPNTDILEIKL